MVASGWFLRGETFSFTAVAFLLFFLLFFCFCVVFLLRYSCGCAVYDRVVHDCGRAVCVRDAFVDVLSCVSAVRARCSLCTLVLGEIPPPYRGFVL